MFDSFFDCLSVGSLDEYERKWRPFLVPFTSENDECFDWLQKKLLELFIERKQSIAERPGNFTQNERAKISISWQTFESSKHLLALKTFSTRLQHNNFMPSKTSWRRLRDVLKTSWKTKNCYAEDVSKTSGRHVLKMSWRNVLKTSWRHYEDKQNT